jgi:hypothetical protein
LQTHPRALALGIIHRCRRLAPLARGAPGNGSDHVQVAQQLFPGAHGNRIFLFDLAPGAQEKLRVPDDTTSHGGNSVAPGRIQDAHFPGTELTVGNLYGEAFAVIPVGARDGRQVLHGRVRSDFPEPYELLDGLWQLAYQSQAARNPRHAPVKPPRKIFQAEPEAAMQLGQQPALFERRFSFRRALGPVQYQGFSFVHVPNRGAHHIVPEALKCPDPLVAVDDQEPVRLFRKANDDYGHLLPSFGQGRQ